MLQLTLNVGPDTDAGFVADVLIDLGALSAVVTDRNKGTADEQALFHIASPNDDGNVLSKGDLNESTVLWSDAVVEAYFPPETSLENVTMSLFSNFDLPMLLQSQQMYSKGTGYGTSTRLFLPLQSAASA
jgi:hypothetical protein